MMTEGRTPWRPECRADSNPESATSFTCFSERQRRRYAELNRSSRAGPIVRSSVVGGSNRRSATDNNPSAVFDMGGLAANLVVKAVATAGPRHGLRW